MSDDESEREAKRRILYDAIVEGEQSGSPQPFDSEEFLRRMHEKYLTRRFTRHFSIDR